MKDAVAGVYNKGKIDKGLAFPTCICVNNTVGHFSPVGLGTTPRARADRLTDTHTHTHTPHSLRLSLTQTAGLSGTLYVIVACSSRRSARKC